MTNLKIIFGKFVCEGTVKSIEPYGSGHIHDTYRVETKEEKCDNYILQRLNNVVFKNIEQLQSNITFVTEHIRSKLKSDKSADLKRNVLTLLPCEDGKSYYLDEDGIYWRLYIFISNHRSYDIVETTQLAREGGKAIGRFQAQLADLDSEQLFETIPYFHDIERRLDTFEKVLSDSRADRAAKAQNETNFVRARAGEMSIILKLGKEGKIPSRTTHNDTKFNNILLDENNKALCVIDLDTVMPGYIHYDFGDAIRTTATSSPEDEPDLKKVELDINLFKAYADGYISKIHEVLSDMEIEYLAFAPRLITFTIGLRFLTDYLDGDRYFKIHHPGHNLQRARTQFKLVESNEKQYGTMQSIIFELVNKYKSQK